MDELKQDQETAAFADTGMPVGDPLPDVSYKPFLALKQITFLYDSTRLSKIEVLTSVNKLFPDQSVETGVPEWKNVSPDKLSPEVLSAIQTLQSALTA